MAAPSFRNIGPNRDLQAFGRYVDERSHPGFCSSHSEPVRFLPYRDLEAYFHYDEGGNDNLETVLRCCYPDGYEVRDVLRAVFQNYLPILAVLIFIGRGEYLDYFLHEPSLRGDRLPFNKNQIRYLPEEIRAGFFHVQWQFCPHTFNWADVADVKLLDGEILPLSRDLIGEGRSAEVFKVQLHKDYNRLRECFGEEDEDAIAVDRDRHTFAIKTYDGTNTEAAACYRSELRALQRLHGRPGIVNFFGSFRQGDTLNIILEYADQGNLEQYMKRNDGPETKDDVQKFWTEFRKIVQGLANIHNLEPTNAHPNGVFQGWHQDIKPENILVFSNGKESPYEFEFKLADLGLCQLERSHPDSTNPTTTYKPGSRTYSDPELFRARESIVFDLKIQQAVDIWSMACIFSVVCTWVVKNWKGVDEYRSRRKAAPSRQYGFDSDTDCFHDGHYVLKEVEDWHAHLSERSRNGDQVTRCLWDGLLSLTFVAWEERPDAMSFFARAKMCIAGSVSPEASEIGSRSQTVRTRRTPNDSATILERSSTVGQQPNRGSQTRPLRSATTATQTPSKSHTPSNSNDSIRYQHNSLRRFPLPSPPTSPQKGAEHISAHEIHSSFMNQPSTSTIIFDEPKRISNGTAFCDTSFEPPTRTSHEYRHERRRPQESVVEQNHISERHALHGLLGQATAKEHVSAPQPCPVHTSSAEIETWPFEEFVKYKSMPKPRIVPHSHLRSQVEARDQVFLIDDSRSMKAQWEAVGKVAGALAYFAKELDEDYMELYFTSCSVEPKRYTKSTPLVDKIRERSDHLQPKTNPVRALDRIFNDHMKSLQHGKRARSHGFPHGSIKPAPITIYFLTDGDWHSYTDLSDVIERMVRFVYQHGKIKNHIGIQIIQFGQNADAIESLQKYDDLKIPVDGRVYDIVDMENHEGNAWKMFLGSVDPRFDAHRDLAPGTSCTCGEQGLSLI